MQKLYKKDLIAPAGCGCAGGCWCSCSCGRCNCFCTGEGVNVTGMEIYTAQVRDTTWANVGDFAYDAGVNIIPTMPVP